MTIDARKHQAEIDGGDHRLHLGGSRPTAPSSSRRPTAPRSRSAADRNWRCGASSPSTSPASPSPGASTPARRPAARDRARPAAAARRPATGRISGHDDEPLSRPPDVVQPGGNRFATGTASPPTRPALEDGYRERWQHDGSCARARRRGFPRHTWWNVYVEGASSPWEAQPTDYPRTRPDLCRPPARAARVARLAGAALQQPRGIFRRALAAAEVVARPRADDAGRRLEINHRIRKSAPLMFSRSAALAASVRSTWDEVQRTQRLAAANAYTVEERSGPDRVFGFSPIPAMSMVSYAPARASVAARRRLHIVLRLVLRPAAG